MRLPMAGDLLLDKHSIPSEEPAPVAERILHQPNFIADDGPIGQLLAQRNLPVSG